MKICLVYPLATWLDGYSGGGAEKQVGLLAQHLTHRRHEVTLVTTAHPGAERRAGGIHVQPAWDMERGLRLVRGFTYRLPSLRRVLEGIHADVYYVRGTLSYARWVVSAAHAVGAPFLLGLASDLDLGPEAGRKLVSFGRPAADKVAGRLAWSLLQRKVLLSADALVVQNAAQAEHCRRMGLPHVLIPSIVEDPCPELLSSTPEWDAVWAGNVHGRGRHIKGLDDLELLARALPHVRIAIVGRLDVPAGEAKLAGLVGLPNTFELGSLPYDEAQRSIARSRLILNTSSSEGFSNVMLEGWALGKPSVTLAVNPSDLLAPGRWPSGEGRETGFRHSLGACAQGDAGLLPSLVEEALRDEPARVEVGERCREYVRAEHSPDAVCARYEELALALRS